MRHRINDLRHSSGSFQPRQRPNVALLVESSRSYGRALLRGIALYARNQTDWSLMHQEMASDAESPEWLESTPISGILARIETQETIDRLQRLNIPTVDLRCRFTIDAIPQVETDDRRVAQFAFEHLLDRGFRRFAFCGFQSANYSIRRLTFFRELVDEAGFPLSVYESPGSRHQPTNSMELSGLLDADQVSHWLTTLTAPTGLFVCNDIRGQQVLNACRSLDIAVPDDIGVIGVDDDDAICPLCDPPLSSVRPDAERAGYRAAEILHGMMQGQMPPNKIEFVPPTSVVRRLSTEVDAVDDRAIARSCQFIREHACEGINVDDVASYVALSRRQLERRFRKELGRTPHNEITAVQISRVKQLLRETTMTLEQITPLAGYSYKERLSAVFKRETGETPGEYRSRDNIDEVPLGTRIR